MNDNKKQGVKNAVELIDVWKSYGSQQVLKGINLSIAENKTTVIVGGSGQGKSQIIKHILGLIRPDSGKVVVFGQDISRANSSLFTINSRLQQALLCSLKYQAGQNVAGISTGINTDAVRCKFNLQGNTVAMYDHRPMLTLALHKLITNPKLVFQPLLVEGNAGPDACMHEVVTTAAPMAGAIFKKTTVSVRQVLLQLARQQWETLQGRNMRQRNIITGERFTAAKADPAGSFGRSGNEIQHRLLVVAAQIYAFKPRQRLN